VAADSLPEWHGETEWIQLRKWCCSNRDGYGNGGGVSAGLEDKLTDIFASHRSSSRQLVHGDSTETAEGAAPLGGVAVNQLPPSAVLVVRVQFSVPDPPFVT